MLHREPKKRNTKAEECCTGMHSRLSYSCILAESVGACHGGVTPVPQLAVNWAKSTTVPLWYLSIPLSLTYFLPTYSLSLFTLNNVILHHFSKSLFPLGFLSPSFSHTLSIVWLVHFLLLIPKKKIKQGMSQRDKTCLNTKQHSLASKLRMNLPAASSST